MKRSSMIALHSFNCGLSLANSFYAMAANHFIIGIVSIVVLVFSTVTVYKLLTWRREIKIK